MTLRVAIIFLALFCATMLGTARQQNTSSMGQPDARNSAAAADDAQHDQAQNQNQDSQNQNSQTQDSQNQDSQTQALREDLTRMRALVQQMETNLAFVDTTQSPLKHQFQLEIDMWRTMISQMERRLQPKGQVNQVK